MYLDGGNIIFAYLNGFLVRFIGVSTKILDIHINAKGLS